MSLTADNVTLELGDGEQRIKALDNVSVSVRAGELLAVVGPSGAGKSSLLAVCGGLRAPDQGTVKIGSEEITTMKRSELTRLRRDQIGFVFQQSNLVPSLTATEQLLLLVHLKGRRAGAEDREWAAHLLNEVGMSHRADRRPGQLSGGERQRIGIARAFMSRPSLLLVDEPTSMLDQGRGHQIVELLATECKNHDVATLMVTHDTSMLDVVTRTVHIRDGQIHET
jgi:putative ABC transport system ATP-binding protein